MGNLTPIQKSPFRSLITATIPLAFDESMSYLACVCALKSYLENTVIPAVNNDIEAVNQLQDLFDELQSFVDHYFDSLDVQEEINNKLDAMVEDGTFNELLDPYLIIFGGNAKMLGCAGDGVTDDTNAINSAISTCVSSGVQKLVFPSGEYVISSSIILPSNFTIEGMNGAILKYVGDGTDTQHPLIDISGSASSPIENVSINGLTIDCTGQVYKGGPSMEDPTSTCPTPISQGLRGIFVNFGINIDISNCRIIDLYGDGIRIERSHTVKVTDNILNDVGGGNIVAGGTTGYDNFGDGICAFFSWDINFSNNTLINTREYVSGLSTGYICGRSGLEFEYHLTANDINTPGQELFEDKNGTGLVMSNNYVYGYTKGSHVESRVNCIIEGNSFIHNNIGLMDTVSGKSVISNNYFNNDDVGNAYQSGYDAYYGGVAVSEYTNQEPSRTNVVVSNNIFDGDTTGVNIGRSFVTVSSNTFRGNGNNGAIRNNVENIRGLSINGNEFYDCRINLYHTAGATISNNIFSNGTSECIRIEASKNTVIDSNDIDNAVNTSGTVRNLSVVNNNFYARSSYSSLTTFVTFGNTVTNAIFNNNNIDLTDNDTILFLKPSGSQYLKIKNNNFYIKSTRTAEVISLPAGGVTLDIVSNFFFGCGYKATLISCAWDIKGLVLSNNVLDEPTSYLFKQTAGSISGQSKIEFNNGNLSIANFNTPTNLNNRFVQQGEILCRYTKTNDNIVGYFCSQGGYYTTNSWTSTTAYTVGNIVTNGGYVYKCLVGGTASVGPSGTTIGNDETGADNIKWVCMSKLAVLNNITAS